MTPSFHVTTRNALAAIEQRQTAAVGRYIVTNTAGYQSMRHNSIALARAGRLNACSWLACRGLGSPANSCQVGGNKLTLANGAARAAGHHNQTHCGAMGEQVPHPAALGTAVLQYRKQPNNKMLPQQEGSIVLQTSCLVWLQLNETSTSCEG